jgi:hypothetical protein
MTEIILDTDDNAARLVTVELWQSSRGNLYNNEQAARYDGCTHRACDQCGKPTVKHYLICDECRDIKEIQKYAAFTTKLYNGEPIYSERDDVYFFSYQELYDYLIEFDGFVDINNELMIALRIVFCEPNYPQEIDPNDYFCDELHEDGEIDGELLAAFDKLNEAIRAYKKPLSWSPGKIAVRFDDE